MAEAGSPQKAGKWSEQEKLQLAMAICDARGGAAPIKWSTLDIPAGRTIKACQLAWDSLRKQTYPDGVPAKRKGGEGEGGPEDAHNTPSKKRKTALAKEEADPNAADDSPGNKKTAAAKTKRGAKGKVIKSLEEGNVKSEDHA
ncbi:MAG: hypothetical protein M1828_006858 [Chrysothrix sp. TS-e1954]|nr:MAG: hypothetical protein M1828_006858 [Chrysothrix sp. TS-e1954]